jgi:hypothetical protein
MNRGAAVGRHGMPRAQARRAATATRNRNTTQ